MTEEELNLEEIFQEENDQSIRGQYLAELKEARRSGKVQQINSVRSRWRGLDRSSVGELSEDLELTKESRETSGAFSKFSDDQLAEVYQDLARNPSANREGMKALVNEMEKRDR